MPTKRNGFAAICLSLLGILLFCVSCSAASAEEFEPFYRADRGIGAWEKPLDNVRLLTEGKYELSPADEEYGLDPSVMPSEAGLDTLHISGSAQFSEDQFRDLADTLRECAGDDPVYVIDLRSESHALVNGISVSYYELHNWGNPGKTLEEIEADEQERFGSMPGTEVTIYNKSGEEKADEYTFSAESWMTEKELVESEGFGYLRLEALNNHWPEAYLIDEFIEFVKGLDMDHVWLHFHCQAGKGRTGIFMALYDMMKNPDVPLEDIVLRHAMTGSNYFFYTGEPGSDSYKVPLYEEINRNIRLAYEYIQSNRDSNYAVSWSEWLADHPAAEEPEETGDQEGAKRILVVETTDIHGWILDASYEDPNTSQYRLAYIAKVVKDARESGLYDDVLLLDGGDEFQGPPVSDLTHGAPIRAAMDAMGYDAVALGNHEFDWDVTAYGGDEDGTQAPYELGEYVGDSDTPVLAPGLYDAVTGERVSFTRDYAVIEKAGKKIAVVGYIPDYSSSIMTKKIAPFRIDGSLETLDALVREVNAAEQPDATIILGHSKPGPVAEAMDPEEVDLVLGGHSHDIAADVAENGIPYLQGNCFAQGYASAVMVIAPDGTVSVEDLQYTDITENKEALYDTEENLGSLDETVLDISYTAWNEVWEEMSEVLGYTDTPILKVKQVGANSAGNWITGLMLRGTSELGTVASFYNNGGLRTSFEIPEGEDIIQITVNDVFSITPFRNTVLTFDITGPELAKQLADSLKTPNFGDQMSGLTFTYTASGDEETPRGEREYQILSITLDDGTQVDMEDEDTVYRVSTIDFCATLPGSVFEGKEPIVPATDAPIDSDLFIEVLRKEAQENDGYISVDTGARGIEVKEEAQEDESEEQAA